MKCMHQFNTYETFDRRGAWALRKHVPKAAQSWTLKLFRVVYTQIGVRLTLGNVSNPDHKVCSTLRDVNPRYKGYNVTVD